MIAADAVSEKLESDAYACNGRFETKVSDG
jgi:hypothetical protein